MSFLMKPKCRIYVCLELNKQPLSRREYVLTAIPVEELQKCQFIGLKKWLIEKLALKKTDFVALSNSFPECL